MIKLTKKEQIIEDLLCTGLCEKEVANILHISRKTVAQHRSSILKKRNKSTTKEIMADIIAEQKDKIKLLEKEIKHLTVYKQRWGYLRNKAFAERGLGC